MADDSLRKWVVYGVRVCLNKGLDGMGWDGSVG